MACSSCALDMALWDVEMRVPYHKLAVADVEALFDGRGGHEDANLSLLDSFEHCATLRA